MLLKTPPFKATQNKSATTVVECADDYDKATQKIVELSTAIPGSPEEAEMIGLIGVVERWEARRDDASGSTAEKSQI